MKISIIGFDYVCRDMKILFKDTLVYDKNTKLSVYLATQSEINNCDVSFVCVPTPSNENDSCDTSIIEEAVSYCKSNPIILRSTVPVGFSRTLANKYRILDIKNLACLKIQGH